MSKNILYGLYNDEEPLLHAVEKARKAHLDIYDVYTPFPVHGLDHYNLPLVFVSFTISNRNDCFFLYNLWYGTRC